MKCRTVYNHKGEEFELTIEEEKYIRALERISKMESGRLFLIANGTISIRINDAWFDDNIDGSHIAYISCEGGDGGDNN